MKTLGLIPFKEGDLAKIESDVAECKLEHNIHLDFEISGRVLRIYAEQSNGGLTVTLPRHKVASIVRSIFDEVMPAGYMYNIHVKTPEN